MIRRGKVERGDTYFIKGWEGAGKGRGECYFFFPFLFLPVLLDKLIRLAAN